MVKASYKNLYKLIAAEFMCGLYFAVPIQTLFYAAKGLSFTQIMWLDSILLIGLMIFEIPTGIFGDKIGRKWSIAFGALILSLSWIPFFMADTNFYLYGLSFFLSGIAIAFYSGAEEAFIYDELKSFGQESKMQKFFGYYNGARILAVAISSLIGGFLAVRQDMSSFLLLFKLSVIGEIISFLVLTTLKEPPLSEIGRKREHAPEKPLTLFKNGLTLLKNNSDLRRIALLSICSGPFIYVMVYAFQPYFKLAHVPNVWFGIAVSIASLLSMASTVFAHKIEKWFGVEKGMLIVTFIPAFIWLLMGIIFNPIFAVVLYILHTGFSGVRLPIFSDYQNRHIESYNRATVLSIISLMGSLFNIIMRPIFGRLIDINLSLGFITIAAVIIIGSLMFRIKEKHIVKFEPYDI
ncbi:MAG: MFS transporter [Patescibacteria group bacterium]|nr:MFS transporter [Patescibacteria group bacterium]